MKLGLFGYPGDHLERVKAVTAALKRQGADQIICLGGLVWSGRKGEEDQNAPATVLRWLRANDISTLCNDTDRQVAGWRLQALENTTGFIKPRIRKLLGVLTREEAQWMYSRPLTRTIPSDQKESRTKPLSSASSACMVGAWRLAVGWATNRVSRSSAPGR